MFTTKCGIGWHLLAFTARLTTKDVDAEFQSAQPIRQIAHRIAAEQNLPDNWLNDGAKGFLSARHETTTGNGLERQKA
jgi:hypothetical protein